MGYRETFFRNTPSIGGMYRCASCGRLFPKSKIDVDHRISKRLGGTDDLWNLQAMCQHCNRSKGKRSYKKEVAETVVSGAISGLIRGGVSASFTNLTRIGKSVAKQKLKDSLGIKYRR